MRTAVTCMGRIAGWLLALWLPLSAGSAVAQDGPDMREILPYLALVIDTSGSMERLPACACTTASCEECLPDCSLANVGGEAPLSVDGRQLKKNRWAVTLEALTGTFENFECEGLARTSANNATYDIGYYLPYHQPWDCSSQSSGTACAFDSANSMRVQNTDGILDQYATRVRFGLMTFDGWDTYVGYPPLVPADSFDVTRSNSVHGLWSYGGPKPFHYPGCTTDYMMDTGARSATATEGTLVSMNSCSGGGSPGGSISCPSWCFSCDGSQSSINHDIQEALLSARPYGGTPIAASLDDLYYHFKNDVSDQFGGCRNRFALLVTDGYPDSDYREVGCNCANEGDPLDPYRCGGDPTNVAYDPALMKCPYPTADQVANDLVRGRTGDAAMIERLFVVGLAVEDQNVLNELNLIATRGCTETAQICDADGDGNVALFANDLPLLVQNLSAVINSLIEPISRSVPAFARAHETAAAKQYQISTGFEVSTTAGEPWSGVIERTRFQCSLDNVLEQQPLDAPGTPTNGDRFHDVLNAQVTRDLWTAAPPGQTDWPTGVTPDPKEGRLYSEESGAPCGTTGCPKVSLGTNLSPDTLGLASTNTARRDEILAWMRGDAGTPRQLRKLGDIYHSSPVIMGSPSFDTVDEAFNEWRRRTAIANRPLAMYVSSNDGILHAFSVEPNTTLSLDAGEEIWGFVPPLLLNNLETNLNAHQFTMDSTPVVKNVYFGDTPGQVRSADQFHTVLITGMREGGNAYVALDVTDPMNPKFLWQFTDPQMGKTFAQPAIAHAVYTVNDSGTTVHKDGAVAILPGGVGLTGAASGECSNGATNPTMRNSTATVFKTLRSPTDPVGPFDHRSDVRCWQDMGRALYFVEVETGRLLKKIYLNSASARIFPSPLVSTPAVFGAGVGSLTTRGYVVDADGVIWRIDMSAADQVAGNPAAGWTVQPFHDIFFNRGPADGELTYEAPILSVDNAGQVVLLAGTGDNNNFVKTTVRNRVVSLTEVVDPLATGTERFKAAMNWEMRVKAAATGPRFVESELVTGTMGLFNGTLLFGTFIALAGSDACDLGRGRIHAVHYLLRDEAQPNDSTGTYAPMLINDLAVDSDGTSVINVAPENAVSNLMLMGLGVTSRPSCEVPAQTYDVFGNTDFHGIGQASDPSVYLVAQGSGARTTTTLLQNRANSRLGSIDLRLNRPSSLSRVLSWATSID